ncbi:MAG: hypothetical protein NC097_02540 [Clostridium sp.]|nr:hypothetical protein [Prevotella sp.]MCM1428654.1 hypothetical protein [Clostridium sp.]MCM1475783.1 hypothetical protein [Muribaculaceae bacterium]
MSGSYLGRNLISWLVLAIFFVASVGVANSVAQQRKPAAAQNKKNSRPGVQPDPFHRPNPTVPIKPTIPGANRYQQNRVFLEQADSLFKSPGDFSGRQIVSGNVVFRQGGMWMYCDSAYYYADLNSMDAFGHVKMTQGDTLFVYADKVFYDGVSRLARLRCGPSQPSVILKNRRVTLTTDSLDYDLNLSEGWYNYGGRLEDDINTLDSRIGRYNTRSKDAEFFWDVVLVNRKDGYQLLSDTLYYNTATHLARIVTPTRIFGENDTIITSSGTYNTVTGNADLSSRSMIVHRDSAGNVTTLFGDSIVYDKISHISRAFSFGRYSNKKSLPMVLTDTARNSILIGGYGEYNDATQEALATDYPLLKEFSTGDTIYLRADTIRTFVLQTLPDSATLNDSVIANLSSPQLNRPKSYHVAKAYPRARFFKQDVQGIADSITFVELDSMVYLNRGPIVWSGERQISGNQIDIHLIDSTADWARLPNYGLMMEHVDEDFYNQLSGKRILALFENNNLHHMEVEGNVQTIFLPQENDSTFNRLVSAESSNLTADLTDRQIDKLKMWPEVTGDFTPIFLVKKSQKLLPGAAWHGDLRPERVWIDTRWSWSDDLGEVSPALEEYFRNIHADRLSNKSAP